MAGLFLPVLVSWLCSKARFHGPSPVACIRDEVTEKSEWMEAQILL